MTDDAGGKATEQLAAIESLDQALRAAGLDYWLFGGWGVDFWVGRVTRDHADIDAAVWRRDYDEIRAALLAAGWRHTPLETDVVGTRYRWRSSELELTFVEDRGGTVVVPIPEHEVSGQKSLSETTNARYRACAPASSHLSCFEMASNDRARRPRRRPRTSLITQLSRTSSLSSATSPTREGGT